MIYTSYFSSKKYKPEEGISIARWCKFWSGLSYTALAPSTELLSWWKSLSSIEQETTEAKQCYANLYKEQTLSKLNPAEVAMILEGKTLLCFEKAGDFCHRHIVAEWLRDAGFECEEL